MGFGEIPGKLAKKAAIIKEKSEMVIREMDYRAQVDNIDESIQDKYAEIGKLVCSHMAAGEGFRTSKEIEEKYREIAMLKRKYKDVIKRLNYSSRDIFYCDNCGEGISEGEHYCPICGKKIR